MYLEVCSFFFPTQHLSAVIFSMCSQRLEELSDLRHVDFFIYLLRSKKRDMKRSLNYCHCSNILQNWDLLGISLKGTLNISLCAENEG